MISKRRNDASEPTGEWRLERDSLGEVRVPAKALWGAQTQRAIDNFPISGVRFPRSFIRALGLIKSTAAKVNCHLGLLEAMKADAISQAADEVAAGRWDDQFPVDIFQTGSGTSTNMNANEVIASRARQILRLSLTGSAAATPPAIHPNDHVNLGQSSNDVIPSAIHIAAALEVNEALLADLRHLWHTLRARASEIDGIVATGRTHLMDAMPIRLGWRIGAWASQVSLAIERIGACRPRLTQLALGGTAVGTGINTHPEFGRRMAAGLSERTGIEFSETSDHYAAQGSMDTAAELSAQLKTAATALMKIADDLRWMNSGPLAGLGEISLPALQPGSSIMPGKVNPVACEAMMMTAAQVIANDLAVTIGNERGNFELNTMLPLIARNLLESIHILGSAARVLADRAVAGFTVDEARLAESLEKNPILATVLAPAIGYDQAAKIAKRAATEGRRVRDIAAEDTGLPSEELDRLLNPRLLTNG